MKRIFTFITTAILIATVFLPQQVGGQAPEKMSYQAVVRDASDELVTNTSVGMKISILQGSASGVIVYAETQTPTTNANGLVSIEIGNGTLVNGNFTTIDWSAGPYYLKTETDPAGGISYSITGTSQLMSVPYALYAKTAKNLTDSIIETDPVFSASVAGEITAADTTNWNSKLDTETDGSVTNEIQTLSISNDTISLSDGGLVKVPYGPSGAATNDLITYDGTNWVAKHAVIGNTGGGQAQNNMQPYICIYHIIALQGTFPSRNCTTPFIAEISMFAGNFAPRNWAFCDGQLLAISSNTALFSLVGTTYGGDGRTTFGLPDLRGRTVVHPGQGSGLSTRTWGERGGVETTTMTINQMPEHTHTITYE